MIYAQFFRDDGSGKLAEACGDRSVVILDGRSPARHNGWADEECRRRGYVAWQLMKGDRFSDARPITAAKRV